MITEGKNGYKIDLVAEKDVYILKIWRDDTHVDLYVDKADGQVTEALYYCLSHVQSIEIPYGPAY